MAGSEIQPRSSCTIQSAGSRQACGRVLRIQRLEARQDLAGEDRRVRRVGVGVRGPAHRSISPMTMSTLALMAITSDSSAPSHIRGSAERLRNEGGRMRQRTGLALPSDTK